MNWTEGLKAFGFGAFAAVSLPIGAVLGIWLRPSSHILGAIMAFGSGALLAALTLELVHPALNEGFWPVAGGIAAGCIIFVVFNQILNDRGAFLRKSSTLVSNLRFRKRKNVEHLVEQLSKTTLLVNLPADEIHALIPYVHERNFPTGAVIFRQGDFGDSMYLIRSGRVEVTHGSDGAAFDSSGEKIADLGPGDTFGEISLLTGEPRTGTVTATGDVKTWKIHRKELLELMQKSPRLTSAVVALAESRTDGGTLTEHEADARAKKWRRETLHNLRNESLAPSLTEVSEAVNEQKEHGGAALAIMLGTFLDGVPESVVVGASMVGAAAISLPLIGGIFISNLPESMSSAVMMKRQGDKTSKIMAMWIGFALISGICAFIGNVFLQGASHSVHALIEGIAAGGMLAMVAQTMLPEACEQGGSLVGLLTVFGFLSAIFIKTLE